MKCEYEKKKKKKKRIEEGEEESRDYEDVIDSKKLTSKENKGMRRVASTGISISENIR